MAIAVESYPAQYLVRLYWECRENKLLPAPGGPGDQTHFAMELFEFLDGIVGEARKRAHDEAKAKSK